MSLHAPFLGWKRTSCTLLVAAMFAHPMQAQASSDDGVSVEVIGGGPVKDCGWPSVVYLNTTTSLRQPGMCTGTLIHPRVILYAAHCGTLNHFRFGKDPIEPAKVYEKETIERSGTHPDYRHVQNVEVDWAYALLKEPIKDVPITPLSYGCELDQLMKQGQPVRFVGFSPNVGKGQARPKAEVGKYAKRHAATTITDVKKGRLVMREVGKHVCEGDSGGPLMAKLPKGGWRTVGIASIMSGGDCKDDGAYSSHAKVRKELVEWVEKESGVDVTPCYDSDGKPEPSAECDRFKAFNDDPMSPKGSWDKMCSEAPLAKVRDACGVPESGEEPDEEEDKKKDEEEDKKKGDEEEDKKKGDEEEDDEKKKDEEEDEKKKDEEEDDDKKKDDEEEDEDKKKDDEEEDENNDDGGEDEGKKKKKDDEEKKDDNEAKPGSTTPSKGGGCSVAGGSGALPLGVLVLVGLAGVRTRRRFL